MNARLDLTPRLRPLSPRRSAILSVLDVGTNKIACLIAKLKPRTGGEALKRRTHSIEILGVGHIRSRGVKCGTVVDLAAAEDAIRHAIDAAERSARLQVEQVIVSLTAGRLNSEAYRAGIDLKRAAVSDTDVERVLSAAGAYAVQGGRTVLHALPIGFSVDDNTGIKDPRGMLGRRLGADLNVITADMAGARNLMLAVERSHLEVAGVVAAPYASALATLTDDEAEIGVACVDMGGGTTTISVVSDGQIVHADAVAIGGHHVTMDLARGLSCRIGDAERLKTLFGSVVAAGADDHDSVTVPVLGEDDRTHRNSVTKAQLVRIVRPRVDEILELVRDRLIRSGFAGIAGGRIVLTGGAAQLTGIADLASRVLGRQVRIGRPLGISGLPEAAKGPSFAAACGLLVYPQVAASEHFEPRPHLRRGQASGGYIARVGRWLKESF
ncbi:cell division protein FtsA [Blastochloris tepida]|uniref:Cell division protein FtsA n=1 Tax=Blastochloris tepida TaxID=2233851 RepID=A0A348FWC0_9HYPH|nr:cell division protein FtsA [Blastochloris tepida]BBF91603.1 cell division protein FtsA [Blastochloris tepida]